MHGAIYSSQTTDIANHNILIIKTHAIKIPKSYFFHLIFPGNLSIFSENSTHHNHPRKVLMQQVILTILIIAGLALFCIPVLKRIRIIQRGKGEFSLDNLPSRISRFISEVVLQSKVISQRPAAGLMHAFVFWGFMAFILETLNHFTKGYGWEYLGHGVIHWIISAVVAVFAVLALIGIIYLFIRRFIFRPEALGEHLSYTFSPIPHHYFP